jgi:dipeptidyl aminopeptidase/acylaminoacyl peptidase
MRLAAQDTAAIAPPPALSTRGIPPVPARLAQEVDRYTHFRGASFASWNALRPEALIITRFSETAQVHEVKMPGGARTQLTFFPERVLGASSPPRREDYIIVATDVGGGEWTQLIRLDRKTGATTLLTDGRSRNSAGAFSPDGGRLAFSSTKRNGKDMDFYIMDPFRPEEARMLIELDRGESWGILDWSPDGSTLLAGEYISANESSLWLVDVATGRKTRLTSASTEQVAYGPAAYSRDGRKVYAVTDRDSEFKRLVAITPSTGAEVVLTSGLDWDVASFAESWNGRIMATVTNENGMGVLRLMDLRTKRAMPSPSLPPGVIGGLAWHPDNLHLGFTLSSARSPSDMHTWNARTGKVERWTMSETGGLNAGEFAEPKLIRWRSFDDREITGFLYQPPARFGGKRPVIVEIHGGPESQARPGFQARSNYWLNELGIARVVPNIRGSSGYGKSFLKLDNGFKREDSYRDLEALLDWIAQQPGLDGERIMITGGSYGGHAVLALAARVPEKIRCAVSVVGISNLVTFLERTEAYRRDLRRVEYGDERDSTMRAFLEKIAPLNNVEKMTKPLFVIQGKNDPRVPVSEAEQIVATLEKSRTPVWYLLAANEGHGFSRKENQDFQFYATIMFVREHLLK